MNGEKELKSVIKITGFLCLTVLPSWHTEKTFASCQYLKKDSTGRSHYTQFTIRSFPLRIRQITDSSVLSEKPCGFATFHPTHCNNQRLCCWKISNNNIWDKLSILWNPGSCGHLSGEAINMGWFSIVKFVICSGPWGCFLYFQRL